MTQRTKEERIDRLTQQWKHAKQEEASWNAQRVSIESEIYELVQKDLPEKGTYTTLCGMKIATGFSEDWNQAVLNDAHQKWNAQVPFPFSGVWKPDGKAVSYLRENVPDLYKLIQPALTLKPKKPAFSVKE